MLDGLILGWLLLAWGAQAVVPWRLASAGPEQRRRWPLSLLPLLTGGALGALLYARSHADAAVAQGLYPLTASVPGRVLAVLFAALALAAVVALAGRRRLEDAGWRIAAAFGLAFLLAASWAGELLRTGEGPASEPLPLAALAALRALVALGAAESAAPGRPRLAGAAGLALPLYGLLLPARLAGLLWRQGQALTLGAATLLLLTARWLPASLRRPALAGATLLAGAFLAQAADLSRQLAPLSIEHSDF
ncbi:MAG TPA: hypothetical protein VGX68_05375 [Thermoanaerobaculia bacterium]|jgi:hypothetical protein|nr:hypothetical protein [Thermoanaerobaculia bacterium]